MKKVVSVFLVLIAVLGMFSGCNGSEDKTTDTDTTEKVVKEKIIGISKIVAHPALDAVEQGIIDELKALGFTDLKFDVQNANGDANAAASIAAKFKSAGVLLAVGIATPTAQALANVLKKIPVIYAAVTDPVAAGLVKSFDQGGENITGVSDLTPVKEQIELLMRLTTIKKLGHIYSSGEANAVQLKDMAKKACDELGLEFIEVSITNSSEVKQAAQTLAGKVDGIYISTDNTVVSALPAVTDVAMKNNIPVITADPSSAELADVLAAWGFDYYKMGRAAGRMIADVLNGKKTSDIPTMFMTDPSDIDLVINLDVAEKLGITFPADLIEKAGKIIEDGELKTK